MATTLPTITIQDDAIVQKLLESFKGTIDPTTGLEIPPAKAYRNWLRSNLIAHVAQMNADKKALARQIQDEADLKAEKEALENAIPQ